MFAVNRLLENDEDDVEEIDLENTDGEDSDYNASEPGSDDSDEEPAALVEISQLEGIEFARHGNRSQKLVVSKQQTGSAYVFTSAEGDRVDLPAGSVHVLAHPPEFPTRLEWCTLESIKKGSRPLAECLDDPQKTLCLKPLTTPQWQRVCKEKVTACKGAKWGKGLWSALVQATTHKNDEDLIAKHPAVTTCLPRPYVGWSHCKQTVRKPTKATPPAAPATTEPEPAGPSAAPTSAPAANTELATPTKAKAKPKPKAKAKPKAQATLVTPPSLKRKPTEATAEPAEKRAKPAPEAEPEPTPASASVHATQPPAGATQYTLTVTSANVDLLKALAQNLSNASA